MVDYNLEGLNPRDFQHMVQAIARSVISPAVVAYGDGPDGARDLTCNGPMNYPAAKASWNGYMVLSCKFKQAPADAKKNLAWLKSEMAKDVAKYRKRRDLRKPWYYLIATNLKLTASNKTGTRDRMESELAATAKRLNLKGFGVWDYNDLRGFLDNFADIRTAYGHLVTAGDVLATLGKSSGGDSTKFIKAIALYLEKELNSEVAAKLQAAGDDPELRISLANVFLDVPYVSNPAEATSAPPPQEREFVVRTLLKHGSSPLRPSLRQAEERERQPTKQQDKARAMRYSEFVIVGGPGQGKSTVAQYLCQLYRAALLRSYTHSVRLHTESKRCIDDLEKSYKDGLPAARRFPVNVELKAFASAIQSDKGLTLLRYIRQQVEKLSNLTISEDVFHNWLATSPWLLVLDGLDEVPPTSNRAELMKEIENFRIDAASVDADMLVVATTRPQSYGKEFPAEQFQHLYLTPLDQNLALEYGEKLVKAKYRTDDRRASELLHHLKSACRAETTARLMQTPLQVTIMATLLEETGEPPQQRYRLFFEYYRTIYKRETRRNLLGGILSERQVDIDFIHAHTGLLLQAAGEPSADASAVVRDNALSNDQFRAVVEGRLADRGVPPDALNELVRRIADSSLQRLVFLVRQQEGLVRFDLTSLQEFMAAEALVNGTDTAVKERLQTIAGAPHWRNVLLFAIGKCFVSREHLASEAINLCNQLNDSAAAAELFGDKLVGEVSAASLAGSRLALDFLVDGSARQAFKIESQLAHIALDLVRVCEPETLARLASVWSEGLSEHYVDATKEWLGQSDFWARTGAWLLVMAGADRSQAWALELLERNWPSDAQAAADLLEWHANYSTQGWIKTKLLRVLEELGPQVFTSQPWRHRHDVSTLPIKWRRLFQFMRGGRFAVSAKVDAPLGGWIPKLYIRAIAHTSRLPQILARFDSTRPGWVVWDAARSFAEEPGPDTLGEALEKIAGVFDEYLFYRYPTLAWPLSACLAACRSQNELLELSKKARSGALGDFQVWRAAESRWKRVGLTIADIEAMTDAAWPFSSEIDRIGFPLAASIGFPHRPPSGDQSALFTLLERYSTEAQKFRAWLASSILDALGLFDFKPRQPFTLPQLGQLASWLSSMDVRYASIPLNDLSRGKLSDEDLESLALIGRSNLSVWFTEPPQGTDSLIEAIARRADLADGLFSLLVRLADQHASVTMPSWLLGSLEQNSKVDSRLLNIMRLASDADPARVSWLASTIIENSDLYHANLALDILARSNPMSEAALAIDLLKRCPRSSALAQRIRNRAHDSAQRFLAATPTKLQSAGVWKKLELPFRV